MNDAAREVLVAAALRGHPQTQGEMHAEEGFGECALGVLHLTMHPTRGAAVMCSLRGRVALHPEWAWYGFNTATMHEVILRNDEGEDFLTIARKVGRGE